MPSRIAPPELPGWIVSRPRVIRCIEKGVRQATVTVVSGPAGSGKTVAITQWLAAARWPGPVAWMAVDEYDDAGDHFWQHLIAALSAAGVAVPQTPSPGDPEVPLVIATVLAVQVNPVLLVLDNLHLLREPKLAARVGYMLSQAKPGLRLLVGSRSDQPIPLRHFLLTGDIAEVHPDQLAFTGAETRTLFGQYDMSAYRESVPPLLKKAEGWAAGLRFIAIALSDAPSYGSGDLTGAPRMTGEYLVSEAFDTQPARTQDFLLRTSVPERITQDLARELAQQGDSTLSLTDLVRENLFVQPDVGGWYRYHELFREALLAKLRDSDPELLGDLRRATAKWCVRQGRLAEAMRYAASAGDQPLAARIAVDGLAIGRLIDPHQGPTLADAVGSGFRSPAAAPEYVFTAAMALARRDYETASAWLSRTGDVLSAVPVGQETSARMGAALIRFELARNEGDPRGAYEAANELEAALDGLPEQVRASRPDLAFGVTSCRGEALLWLGRFDEAVKVFTQAVAMHVPAVAAVEHAAGLGRLALAEALCGHLGRAAELSARGTAVGSGTPALDLGAEPPNVPADIALALVHLERYELPDAHSALRRAEAGLRTRGDRVSSAAASLIASRLYLAEGHPAPAMGILSRVRQDWTPPAWLDCQLTLARARALVMAGDPLAALEMVSDDDTMPPLEAAIARAHAWGITGNLAAARRNTRYVLEIAAAEPGRVDGRAMIDALLADARVHYTAGDHVLGRGSVARAVRIAREEEVRLPFQMEHSWLFPVLRADNELAQSYETLSRSDDAGQAAETKAVVVESLTERECQVLSRVAQLLSTAEIANELYISVNTVKTHLKSVHRKLAVTDRREAVRRARQLNLL